MCKYICIFRKIPKFAEIYIKNTSRTYFFDVKSTKGNDYYLTITESKRKVEKDGRFAYDKHKIFLYKEDFDKFAEGLQEVIDYIRENCLSGEAGTVNSVPQDKDKDVENGFSDVNFEEL